MRAVAPITTIRTVIMKASNDFQSSAQRTIQTTNPRTAVRMKPMSAGTLSKGAGEALDEHADVLTVGGGPHEARADDDAVGAGIGRLGGVLGRRDPKAQRDRNVRVLTCPLHRGGERVAQRVALTGGAGDRHRVEEAAGALA